MKSFCRRHDISIDDFKELSQTYNTNYHSKPIPVLIQPKIPEELIQKIDDYNLKNGTSYGFNISSILSLEQIKKKNKCDKKYKEQFQLEKTGAGVEYLISIFESVVSRPMKNCIMDDVENTQSHYNSRRSDLNDPKLFLMFLPLNGDIDTLQKTMIKFLEKHKLWTDYHVTYSNSKSKLDEDNKKYKEFVDKQIEKTKAAKKKGCILLLGHQGKMAYTYNECDVVIRLDNGTDIDDAEQVGYRCLTESEGKTIGIVVDLNIQRVYNVMRNKIKEYKMNNPNSNKTYGDIIQYMYTENQFIFNPHEYDFGNSTEEMIEYYKKYAFVLKSETLIETVTCNIQVNGDPLSEHIKQIKMKDGTYQANPKLNGKQPEVTKGDKTKKKADPIKGDDVQVLNADEDKNEDNEPEIDIFNDINKTKNLYEFLSKLSCLMLRLDYKNPNITNNVIELLKTLKVNEKRFNIIKMKLIDDYSIDDENLKEIYDIYINDMNNQNNIDILDDIFEIYANSKPEVVREIIGKHFIPSLDQKKKNAEIPTPPELCDEMIDKIPKEYFMNKNNKTFEPCCGKGNFVLAIFEGCFEGLSHIEDECERCIHIIENCLYFCDIDPMNVYITEELVKCHALSKMKEEYWKDWENVIKICDVNFNSHVGDTLKLNIQDKWGVEGFDAVIGNPPYENRNKKGDNSLYMEFIKYSLNILKLSAYLLFITPHMALNYLFKNKTKSDRYINKNYQIDYIDLTPAKYFNVGSTFVYFLLVNSECSIDFKYKINSLNGEYLYYKKDLKYIPFEYLSPDIINILKKLIYKDKKMNIKHMINTNGSMQRIRKEHFVKNIVTSEKTATYKYEIIYGNTKTKGKETAWINTKMVDYEKYKIIISKNSYINPIYMNNINIADSMCYILATEDEYKKFCDFIDGSIFNFLVKILKTGKSHYEILSMIQGNIGKLSETEINIINQSLDIVSS